MSDNQNLSEDNLETPATDCRDKDSDNNPEVHTEDSLEIRKMKFFDRIKAKRQKLKDNMADMSAKQKVGYILYYYKWTILLSIIVLVSAIAIPITIYKKTRPVAISYAIINCMADENVNTGLFEDYKEYYGFADSDQIQFNKSIMLDPEEYNVSIVHNSTKSDYTQFPMLCRNNYFDIVITDEKGLLFCSTQSCVQPLDTRLSPDLYNIIKENYSHLIVEMPNYNGDADEFALDISETEFAEKLGLDYDKIYICFPGTSERNIINTKKILDYIFNLGLEF